MENIKYDNLLETLKNLKQDEKIYLRVNDDILNVIELSTVQSNSMENLFMSYLNNTSTVYNQMNLERFLNKYAEKFKLKMKTIEDCIFSLGEDVYNLINYSIFNGRKKYYYFIDFNLKRLIIGCNF